MSDFKSEITVGKLVTSALVQTYQTWPCYSAGAFIRDNTVIQIGGGDKSGTCRLFVWTSPLDFKLVPGLRVGRKNWTGLGYVIFLLRKAKFCSLKSFPVVTKQNSHFKYQSNDIEYDWSAYASVALIFQFYVKT